MENQFSDRGPEAALMGEDHTSKRMGRMIFRIEADRLVAIGQGTVVVF